MESKTEMFSVFGSVQGTVIMCPSSRLEIECFGSKSAKENTSNFSIDIQTFRCEQKYSHLLEFYSNRSNSNDKVRKTSFFELKYNPYIRL